MFSGCSPNVCLCCVIYCAQAAVRLAKVYKAPQVWLYKGGVQEWQNAGGLLEQGKPIVQMS